jgi:hypothetical protein
MVDSSLSLVITEQVYTLQSFRIERVSLCVGVSATILIEIEASNAKIYNRTFYISGQEYQDWTTDDYIYAYIQRNIETIFAYGD